MPGAVFVYNLFSEQAQRLSLNGAPALSPSGTDASTIDGWGDASNGYMPSHTQVGSAIHNDEDAGHFYRGGNGLNVLQIEWDSGYAISKEFLMPTASDDVSIDADLVCFITLHFAIVMSVKKIVIKNNLLSFIMPSVP